MNKKSFMLLLLLTLGVAGLAMADDTNIVASTNLPSVLNWSYFESIAQKNIFNPSRSGRGGRNRDLPTRLPVYRYFTYHGTMDDTAIFTGEGAPHRGFVKVGDLINGYKVMQITLHHVKLVDPSGSIVILAVDDTMRREDDGPWAKTDQPAPLVITPAAPAPGDATVAGAPGAAPAAPPAESDILRKLRLKREQEDK